MASPSRRRHRREHRRAHKKKMTKITRYNVYCSERGEPAQHEICVTQDGRIFFPNHPDEPLQAMKAEATFGHICGCYWAAVRILLPHREAERICFDYKRSSCDDTDRKNLEPAFIYFLHKLNAIRESQRTTRNILRALTMQPVEMSIQYRTALVIDRFSHRVNQLSLRLRASRGEILTRREFTKFETPEMHGTLEERYYMPHGWDY